MWCRLQYSNHMSNGLMRNYMYSFQEGTVIDRDKDIGMRGKMKDLSIWV